MRCSSWKSTKIPSKTGPFADKAEGSFVYKHPLFLFLFSTHQDGVRRVDSDLVIGGVAAGQPQVEVLDVEVHVWQDELALDVVPKYAQHVRAEDRSDKRSGGTVCKLNKRAPDNNQVSTRYEMKLGTVVENIFRGWKHPEETPGSNHHQQSRSSNRCGCPAASHHTEGQIMADGPTCLCMTNQRARFYA